MIDRTFKEKQVFVYKNKNPCSANKTIGLFLMKKKGGMFVLLLVDGNFFLHRAFYACPKMNAPNGTPTNAVFGFLKMLKNLLAITTPTHIAVCFDASKNTFRKKIYPEYKANRKPTPVDLIKQFPVIRQVLAGANIMCFEHPEYEADDLLGTIAAWSNMPTKIASGDRDIYQLISPQTTFLYYNNGYKRLGSGTTYLGYPPEKMVDIKALAGDSADNIPGCPRVGEKTAIKLIKKYGSLSNILDNADNIPGKLGQNIRVNRNKILLSLELAKINCNCPIDIDCSNLLLEIDSIIGSVVLSELGIKSINLGNFHQKEK